AKCTDLDYINFLTASSNYFTCTEAERCQPADSSSPAHDAFTRLLQRQPSDTEALWNEVTDCVCRDSGYLVVDDTTLDKPYAKKMDLVYYHWSGKHHRAVPGITLVTLLWTDGGTLIPVDFRIYDPDRDGKTKNDHFLDMLQIAKERGFQPEYVLFDSWYSSIENLKAIRRHEWHWLTRLKKNRLVNPDKTGNVQVHTIEIPPEGLIVHLKAYGFVKVFRKEDPEGNEDFWATDILGLKEARREELAKSAWKIEIFHRGVKQFCGVEKCQARKAQSQRTHVLMAVRAFVRLEINRIKTGVSWFEAKAQIHREAIKTYIRNPRYALG
ncbi:transposase, partial [Methanoculleus sp. FWC-SCC1]